MNIATFAFKLHELSKKYPDKELGELLSNVTYRAEGHTDPSFMTTEAAIQAVNDELEGKPL